MSGKGSGSLSLARVVPLLGAFVALSMVAGLLSAGVALPFVGSAGLVAKSASDHFEDLPGDFQTPNLPQRTRILDANGDVMAYIWGNEGNRVVVPMSQISPYMPKALVAIEDSNFYKEGPLSIRGTLRAAVTDANAGGAAQGGSTLTQQYVKNVLVQEAGDNPEALAKANGDTLSRKIQELKYAVAVYKKFTKNEILERYLNLVYFGENAYGIQVAAETYFSVPASQLTIPEAATLAGVVNSPNQLDPLTNPTLAMQRRNIVLQKMAAAHYITQQQAKAAEASPIGTKPSKQQEGCISAPRSEQFFCEYVLYDIESSSVYGKTLADRKAFLDSGLTIKTTAVPQVANSIQTAISDHVAPTDSVATAMVVIQPGTGKIEGMAQSRPMGSGKGETYVNYSADPGHGGTSGMQAGSTFKAFVGMAALEKGIKPNYEINAKYELDEPGAQMQTCVDGQNGNWVWPPDGPDGWQPTNQTQGESGPNTMTTAYWKSVNTYFIQLEQQTGLCQPAKIAQSFGVTKDSDDGTGKPLDQYGSFTLGTNPITPIAMANAYATIAANGVYCKPIEIASITENNGKSAPVPQADCHSVISPQITTTLTSMLEGVIQNPQGTGYGVADIKGHPAAGKTGTNDSMAMTWFDGYTPNLAAAVWTGNPNDPNSAEDNVELHGADYPNGDYIGKLYGAAVSAPVFGQGMSDAMANMPVVPFSVQAAGDGMSPKNPAGANAGQNGNQGLLGGVFGGNGGKGGNGGNNAGGQAGGTLSPAGGQPGGVPGQNGTTTGGLAAPGDFGLIG